MSDAGRDIESADTTRASRGEADAFDELSGEHRLIQRVAEGLARWTRLDPAADGRLELRRFVGFFRHFVERCHFAKEDAIASGPARSIDSCAPDLAEMERGHARCQRSITKLHQLATMHSAWTRPERRAVESAADELASSLRDVFVLEETRVYPRLREVLPADLQGNLRERLAEHERLRTGRGEHERHVSMAEALARWGTQLVAALS